MKMMTLDRNDISMIRWMCMLTLQEKADQVQSSAINWNWNLSWTVSARHTRMPKAKDDTGFRSQVNPGLHGTLLWKWC